MIVKLQAGDTVYTVYSWFVWCMVIMHVDLKCTGMFLQLLTYCFLVDAIVYFSTLSNVSRWSFPHFNLL